jgi:hypothetical protein
MGGYPPVPYFVAAAITLPIWIVPAGFIYCGVLVHHAVSELCDAFLTITFSWLFMM